jgi:hypothetical protein
MIKVEDTQLKKTGSLKKKYGKVHKHSIYIHCWVCHIWGIGFPNDSVCGNCGSEDTTTYYPEDIWDFIHSAVEEARKEERKQTRSEIMKVKRSYEGLYDEAPIISDAFLEVFRRLDLLKKEK